MTFSRFSGVDAHRSSATLASIAFGLALASASIVFLIVAATLIIDFMPRRIQAIVIPLMSLPEGLLVLCAIGAVIVGHVARRRGAHDWRAVTALVVGYGVLIFFVTLIVAFFVTMSIWTRR